MLNKIHSSLFICLFFVSVLFLSSCRKQEIVRPPIVDEPDPEVSITVPEVAMPKWLPGDYSHIAIIYGYGYETEESRQPVIDFIEDEYGFAKDGGLIETFEFPEEYLNGKRIRVAFLTNTLKDRNLSGVILLGSPDRTYFALADLMESGSTCPVWSLFPVTYTDDEVLGTENGSFFVLSYKLLGSESADSDVSLMKGMSEEAPVFEGNIGDVLRPVIKYIKKSAESTNSPYSPSDAAQYLYAAYSQTLGDCTLERFVEHTSGLPAHNHYVLGVRE